MTFEPVLAVAERIFESDTNEKVFDILLEFAKTVGIDFLFIGRLGYLLSSPPGPPDLFMSNMEAWSKIYLKEGYIHTDPRVHLAMRINRAFHYDEAFQDLTPAQAAFVKHAKEHGLIDGFVVPVHNRVGAPGTVNMGSSQALKLKNVDKLRLEMLAHLAFRVIDNQNNINNKSSMPKLSDRERTVLTLVARGKTNWEIGTILSISEYSVRDYLKALSQKLETSNRTHSVARAMQLGLISP